MYYKNAAKASCSTYLPTYRYFRQISALTWEKKCIFRQKNTTNFGRVFSFPFPLLFFKIAKRCCFCLSKRQKRKQKTRPPPKVHKFWGRNLFVVPCDWNFYITVIIFPGVNFGITLHYIITAKHIGWIKIALYYMILIANSQVAPLLVYTTLH